MRLSKLKRLRHLEGPELRYRIREEMRRRIDHARHLMGARGESEARFQEQPRGEAGSSIGHDFLAYLRTAAAPRFHPSTHPAGRRDIRDLGTRHFGQGWLTTIAEEAERLRAHRFEILGHGVIDAGAELDWHRDPVTGRSWPRRFWTAYDLVRDPSAGDPKTIHEINRHQHLPRLAKASFVLGDEQFAREAVAQMLGWIDQNPRGVGVHWHSSLEIALRSLSWTWTLFLLLSSRALDEEAARRIGGSLFAQLDHVCTYPSIWSSPNTHLLCEATALFVAGATFTGVPGASAWLEKGQGLLLQQVDRQFGGDGVHAELSTWYHCYALDCYLQAMALARHQGRPLPRKVWDRVEKGLEFLRDVARPDGSIPRLGDDDGGRTLALATAHYGSPSDLLSTGAVLFDRGDFKRHADRLPESTFWLLGRSGCRAYDALPAAAPTSLSATYPDAGYVVQRSGWGHGDSQLVFDCGGLGKLGGGHGHADALSVTLFAGGRELLVDPGTFVYGGLPGWRDAFRTTSAHNTVTVDGRSQAEPAGTFQWKSRASARLVEQASFDGIELVAGEHDGYAGGPGGIVHRRRVLWAPPHYWLLLDDFRGHGEHTFDLSFHLPPDARVTPTHAASDAAGLRVTVGDASIGIHLHASAPLEVHVVEPGADRLGWVSDLYGAKREAPVLVARIRAEVPTMVVTVLAPERSGVPALSARSLSFQSRQPGDAPAIAVGVSHPGGAEDVVILSPTRPRVEVGPWRTESEVFWGRRQDGCPTRSLALHARCAFLNDAALPASRPAAPAREASRTVALAPGAAEEDAHVRHRGIL